MNALRSLAVGLALALVAAPAAAQTTGTLKFTGAGTGSTTLSISGLGTVVVGPYQGQLNGPGTPIIDIHCVDFLHWSTLNSTWNVTISPLVAGNLDFTRLGDAALDQYQQAAWLTMQYNGDAKRTRAIQTAIWTITTPTAPNLPNLNPTGTLNDTNYWVTQAANRYRDHDAAFYTQFAVLTPTNFASLTNGGPQEYLVRLHTVPEPGTYLLLGTGLLGLAGVARVRRKQASLQS